MFYLPGDALTIASLRIHPVLPFVFARAGQTFLKSGLQMLIVMGMIFTAVVLLEAMAASWAVKANEYGRYAVVCLLAGFGFRVAIPKLVRLCDAAIGGIGRTHVD